MKFYRSDSLQAMMHDFHISRLVVTGWPLAARILISICLLLVTALTGCGGSDRGPVSGTVTVDGRPLEYGVISFRPAQGNPAPGSGGVVTDGNFQIPAIKGLRPGDYIVSIAAFKKTGRMVSDFPGGPKRPERIPLPIKESDQLKARIGAGDNNLLEFHLQTLHEG
ncbi:MAG: carboxypeptidase regulatory-like domain-containing protein [Pirellulales bacterium]|nr:carboxypeptidase regulatory-like domain-containing protein [Pirellulales bacterium]